MLKKIIIILFIALSTNCEKNVNEEIEVKKVVEENETVKLSEMESQGFVNYAEDYLIKKKRNYLNKYEFIDLILNLYADSNLDEIKDIEEKIKLNQNLKDEEKHNLNFKNHLEDFLEYNEISEKYTEEHIVDIIKNNKVLIYIDELFKGKDGQHDFDFPDFDEDNLDDEELKQYDSMYDEDVKLKNGD